MKRKKEQIIAMQKGISNNINKEGKALTILDYKQKKVVSASHSVDKQQV